MTPSVNTYEARGEVGTGAKGGMTVTASFDFSIGVRATYNVKKDE